MHIRCGEGRRVSCLHSHHFHIFFVRDISLYDLEWDYTIWPRVTWFAPLPRDPRSRSPDPNRDSLAHQIVNIGDPKLTREEKKNINDLKKKPVEEEKVPLHFNKKLYTRVKLNSNLSCECEIFDMDASRYPWILFESVDTPWIWFESVKT